MNYIIIVIWLCFGQSISDLALQSSTIAYYKSVLNSPDHYTWFFYLSGHALINGGITGSIALLFKTRIRLATVILSYSMLAHWLIDFLSTIEITNLVVDQSLHMISILIFAWVINETVKDIERVEK